MIAPQLFPFLRVFNYFIDFFSSIFPRLCRCCVSAVLQPQTCNFFIVSLIKLRAVISHLSPGVPFGRAVRAAVLPRMRPASRRRRARRPFGIYLRHVGPNGSDVSAFGLWLFYDLG